MPTVIQKKEKEVTCQGCRSLIGYKNNDVQLEEYDKDTWASRWTGRPVHILKFIVCPVCGDRIKLSDSFAGHYSD